MDVMYDWDKFYGDKTRGLSGVSKVKDDPASLSGGSSFFATPRVSLK